MTVTSDLFAIAVTALTGTTSAGANVFSVRDFPTWDGNYPIMYIRTPDEDKQGLGRNGAPQFNVVATLTIEAIFQAPSESSAGPFNQAAAIVEAGLSALSHEIEVALINYAPLMELLQQFPFIRTSQTISAEGEQHIGQLLAHIGMEFYQGPEDFYQVQTSALNEVTITTDTTNVFDSTGTYANPPFPSSVTPAPRTEGPDGRAEGYTQINLNP
jgi:hypothetical protein